MTNNEDRKYAICETTNTILYHVRELVDKRLRRGGGANTDAFCGMKVEFDTRIPVSRYNITCKKCMEEFIARNIDEDE